MLDPAQPGGVGRAAAEAPKEQGPTAPSAKRPAATLTVDRRRGQGDQGPCGRGRRSDPDVKRFLEPPAGPGHRRHPHGTFPRPRASDRDWAATGASRPTPTGGTRKREDALLRETLASLYVQAARGSLQVVADAVDGIIPNRAVGRIVDDLLSQGATRIKGINDTTLAAVQEALAEGTRRGYSLDQLIDGVPDRGLPRASAS